MKHLICVSLLLLTLFTGCNITDVSSDIISQNFIVNTWYSEHETFNETDTSYKYHDVVITIEKVLDPDNYPGADDSKYNYSFQVGKLLHLEIKEQLVSGSMGTSYKGFLYDPVDNYEPTMSYTFSSSGTTQTMRLTRTPQDSMVIQFGDKSYRASLVKSSR